MDLKVSTSSGKGLLPAHHHTIKLAISDVLLQFHNKVE